MVLLMLFGNFCLRLFCFALGVEAQYTTVPRWGQAVAIVNDALIVHGGKTDPSNSYSYSSAPTSNDLLYLSLSAPFDASAPPWQLISGSSNPSTPQGPILAWHTLSAINTSTLLLFGGDPGPNSATVIMDRADSALFLNVYDRLNPVWITEPQSWANEPIRRIHHSASSINGKVWLVGGEKDDGSGNAFSDHYVFDPNTSSFTQLPSTDGPSDLYGHASVALPNGLMLVFGGYCQSLNIFVPFSTIWVIDTTRSDLTWVTLSASNASVPFPRREFAVVLLDNGKVLIHGGTDVQTVYSDGWILDTTQNPMVWTPVEVLSELGPRYDHFAVVVGSQVVFGGGYGSNGPADTPLHIYNPSSSSWNPSFTPSPVLPSITSSVPSQTQTDPNPTSASGSVMSTGSMGSSTGSTGLGTGSTGLGTGSSGLGTGSMTWPINPTSTQGGLRPDSTQSPGVNAANKHGNATAIAVGTVFGVIALVVGAFAVARYYKGYNNHPSPNRFHLLGGGGSGDGHDALMANVIPTAGVREEKTRSGWLSGNREMNNQTVQNRRDILADEDTREFGAGPVYGVDRDASGGSTRSVQPVGAAFGSIGAGVRGILSRQNSGDTNSAQPSDPLLGSDATGVLRDVRQVSYASAHPSYLDPFVDSPIDPFAGSDDGDADESTRLTDANPMSHASLPFTASLAPLTEQLSRTSDPTSSSSSHAIHSSSFDSNPSSSFTSTEYKPQRRSSIINAFPLPATSIRRSPSWWARFAPTTLRDRRPPERSSKVHDIRDPNPAPRLVPIRETSSHSSNHDSPEFQTRRNNSGLEHRNSLSSLQTANSDAIERMGGMDVIQRIGTPGSQQTIPNASRDLPDHDPAWATPIPLPAVASSRLVAGSQSQTGHHRTFESPGDTIPLDLSQIDSVADNAAPPSYDSHQPILKGSNVLSRVVAYERRMSQDAEDVPESINPNARNTRKRDEYPSNARVAINYGLAPRRSLFVANPDNTRSPSSES